MLVEHAGLNPMGGKPRAGCPIKNIQATLDSLTSAGLSIAVYEEIGDMNITPRTKVPYHLNLLQIMSFLHV
jgi:hypothetical protein